MAVYPKELKLKDGNVVTARPLEKTDAEAVYKFFEAIPRKDLLIYKLEVKSLESVESWFANPGYKGLIKLVCLNEGDILAKGTLNNEGIFWSSAAEIKLIVRPEYRDEGIGSQMFHILLNEGIERNYRKIIVRYALENLSFSKILSHYGFKPETVLKSYVEDENSGISSDLVIASYNLENWERRFEFYYSLYNK